MEPMEALSEVCESFKSQAISKWVPTKPPDKVLSLHPGHCSISCELCPRKFKRVVALRHDCGHELYESRQQFIEHLLWLLHPDSMPNVQFKEHHRILYPILDKGICMNCINLLLSTVHFSDIINLYNVLQRVTSFKSEWTAHHLRMLSDTLQAAIMRHPKMPRIFAFSSFVNKSKSAGTKALWKNEISFLLDPHDFHYICHMILDNVHSKSLRDSQKIVLIRTLYFSMKYWTKHQLLFFVDRHLFYLKRLVMEYPRRDCIKMIATCILTRTCGKAMRLKGLDLIGMDKQKLMMISKINRELKWVGQPTNFSAIYDCCYDGCNRRGHPDDGVMKVCGGCKMAYYCSRKCQKRGWKNEHREICTRLHKSYGQNM